MLQLNSWGRHRAEVEKLADLLAPKQQTAPPARGGPANSCQLRASHWHLSEKCSPPIGSQKQKPTAFHNQAKSDQRTLPGVLLIYITQAAAGSCQVCSSHTRLVTTRPTADYLLDVLPAMGSTRSDRVHKSVGDLIPPWSAHATSAHSHSREPPAPEVSSNPATQPPGSGRGHRTEMAASIHTWGSAAHPSKASTTNTIPEHRNWPPASSSPSACGGYGAKPGHQSQAHRGDRHQSTAWANHARAMRLPAVRRLAAQGVQSAARPSAGCQ